MKRVNVADLIILLFYILVNTSEVNKKQGKWPLLLDQSVPDGVSGLLPHLAPFTNGGAVEADPGHDIVTYV